jgi:hypothetical protein
MNETDREALTLALARCREEGNGRSAQLDAKLKHEPWEEVAAFAASCCQSRVLNLDPWQDAPCDIDLGDVRLDDVEGAKLLKKMLWLNVSRYDPDPLKACAEAEQRQAAR